MLEEYKEVQPQFFKYVEKVIKNNKLTHAYLIETNGLPYGFDIALALSKTFLCPKNKLKKENCEGCFICSNIEKGNYPDLKIIEADGKNIKKEQLIELQEEFKVKNLYGKYLIYIIKDASLLNKSSANTILKFLEEPEENIIAILITDNIYSCIDTIVSRCQILSLKNNNDNEINENIYMKYKNQQDLQDFIIEVNKNIILFYEDLEKYKQETIVYYDFNYFKDKIELLLLIGLHLYIEVLNIKYDRNIVNLKDFEDKIKKIALNNETSDIIKKIEIINNFLNNNNLNINKELFLDNFIITFSGGIND
ncbi:MAG: hypothetical protein PUC23_02855 [bacterium]|nr:hypothetical protein [bacterium]